MFKQGGSLLPRLAACFPSQERMEEIKKNNNPGKGDLWNAPPTVPEMESKQLPSALGDRCEARGGRVLGTLHVLRGTVVFALTSWQWYAAALHFERDQIIKA